MSAESYPYYQPPAPTMSTALPFFPQFQTKTEPVPEISPPEPPEPAVTPAVASRALQKLISHQLQQAGFNTAVQPAVQRLELEVATFVQQLYQRAHEYANLANRANAVASDVVQACEDFDIEPKDLWAVKNSSLRRRKRGTHDPTKLISLTNPPSRSPSPELLASDDDEGPPPIPATLKNLPSYLPSLPPKHTYLQTPASPPKKAALPSLEKKLKTAGLVQESLQHLLLATEDNMNQEDGELLGHIVNWETTVQPRKRWKVGTK
ncbi:hypothetical protein CVT24_001651 [Panaeolus cyanescens]|uniref:Transcription initiation factor TFIID subunit 8 n=1 Tax=Panaeolus cyanescens TaxID=181874 RepID=A0A409VSY7_9AGAR|nr:hypothetical protein CVT24_001651 [Panaeolus cyanescens]